MSLIQGILPFVFLGAAIVGGIIFVFPKYQAFAEVQHAVQEKRELLERGEEMLAGLRQLKREVETRQEDFAKLDTAIPAQTALPAVYHQLQTLGAQSGLVLTEISSSQEEFGSGVAAATKATVALGFQGSYVGIKSFLGQLKSSPRMFNAQSVHLETQEATEGILRLRINVDAYSYEF